MNWQPLDFTYVRECDIDGWFVWVTFFTPKQRQEFERQIGQKIPSDVVHIPESQFSREQLTLIIKLVLATY